jgi:deoxycytidine triphosphate deaminase
MAEQDGDELTDATQQTARALTPGTLLAGERLLAALRTPDRIFREGSWEPKQLKGAGYELRLAGDLLVLPLKAGDPEYRVIPKGGIIVDEITLAPGDSALISTQEKFSMDFDVTCLIGPKFRWSAKGLLVLQGMVAHPGYGRVQDARGQWIPKDDERLYLVIANIGPANINMRRGDPIAYVQFFDIEPLSERRAIPNLGFDYLAQVLFQADARGSTGGLAYFKNVRDLGLLVQKERQDRVGGLEQVVQLVGKEGNDRAEAVRNLQELIDKHREQRDQRLDVMNERVNVAISATDRVRSATDNVVVFGVFLVSATLLSFALTTLVGLVEKFPGDLDLWKVIVIVAMATLYASSTVGGVIIVARASMRVTSRQEKSGSN